MGARKITLDNFHASEGDLLAAAPHRYGELYSLALDMGDALQTAVRASLTNRPASVALKSAIQKNLTLALLSTVRRHRVQAAGSLRQALELTPLLGFSMVEHDLLRKLFEPAIGATLPVMERTERKLGDQARDWIAAALPGLSHSILEQKRIINQTTSHGNVMNSLFNVRPHEEGLMTVFHDEENLAAERLGLVETIRVGLIVSSLIQQINPRTKTFIMDESFAQRCDRIADRMVEIGPQVAVFGSEEVTDSEVTGISLSQDGEA